MSERDTIPATCPRCPMSAQKEQSEKVDPSNVLSPIEWVECECVDPNCTRRIPINKANRKSEVPRA